MNPNVTMESLVNVNLEPAKFHEKLPLTGHKGKIKVIYLFFSSAVKTFG